MCPRNPLRRTLVARGLSGMRVCSNITICCLPAVLVDLHAHAACLGCQYLISADCRRCPLGDSHWAVGPNLACDGHYVTHLRTSSGRYCGCRSQETSLALKPTCSQGDSLEEVTPAVVMSCFRGIAVVGHQNLLHDVQ